MKKSLVIGSFLTLAFFGALGTPHAMAAPHPIYGWAYSSNIGWISFNCADNSVCGSSNYSVQADDSGNLTGYAWSASIGWIKFGGLSGFPASGSNASMNPNTGNVAGWARACSGTANGDCSNMNSRTDGWDGWIELSGTNHVANDSTGSSGAYFDKTRNVFRGYVWGSDNIGWINLAPAIPGQTALPASNPYSLRCPDGCSSGVLPTVVCTISSPGPSPQTVNSGTTVTFSAVGSNGTAPYTYGYDYYGSGTYPGSGSIVYTNNTAADVTYSPAVMVSDATGTFGNPASCGTVTVRHSDSAQNVDLHSGPSTLTVLGAQTAGSSANKTYVVRRGAQVNVVWLESAIPAGYTCTPNVLLPDGTNGAATWGSYVTGPDFSTSSQVTLTVPNNANSGPHTFNLSCSNGGNPPFLTDPNPPTVIVVVPTLYEF